MQNRSGLIRKKSRNNDGSSDQEKESYNDARACRLREKNVTGDYHKTTEQKFTYNSERRDGDERKEH